MKKLVILFAIVGLILTSCEKEEITREIQVIDTIHVDKITINTVTDTIVADTIVNVIDKDTIEPAIPPTWSDTIEPVTPPTHPWLDTTGYCK